jgi:hypothetical protein
MPSCPIARVTRVLGGVRDALDSHARECGDHVLGVALHPEDHGELSIAEMWGLPVLAWEDVPQGTARLLCEARGLLIPQVDTCQELLDRWNYHLERGVSSEDPLAA